MIAEGESEGIDQASLLKLRDILVVRAVELGSNDQAMPVRIAIH
jgi:hypothetical protein